MPKRPLLWRLLPSYGLLVLAAVLGIAMIALHRFETSSLDALRADLQARADFLNQQLGPDIPDDRTDFAKLCRRYDLASGIRITLLLPHGKVDSDSQNRPEEVESRLDRPELRQAFSGGVHDAVRYNPGLDQRIFYQAVPVMRYDRLFGVLYLSTSLAALDQALWQMQVWILIAGLTLAALTLPLAWWSLHGIVRPLAQIKQAAQGLAGGKWNTRIAIPDERELAESAEAFNCMADQLQQQIGLLTRQNNEQKAVLASMAEGVLAVDGQERIISLNMAAGRMLGLQQSQALGRRLQEVARNADLIRFVNRALFTRESIEADLLMLGNRERVMQARGSALHDLEGRPIGAVIVLNDVTDFRRLEDIRRDFVANVSHELKTPITSIKGFVETLLDGAMKDPDDAERFLRIIAKQSDRLHAIIEDLLSLSKIEQSEDADTIELELAPLRGVLDAAFHACQTIAQERNVQVTLDCDAALQAKINPPLLEQAVVNLLDNAIKYSEPGRQVRLFAAMHEYEISISVTDQGCGIASEHQSRIFERFYRVDRARSRKLGGTGLGLAIVKHIAQAHHGQVSVDSTLGAGSTFTIHLPRP